MSGKDGIPGNTDTHAQRDNTDSSGIIVLCTANVCRSPMAAALLARRLAVLGVHGAGTLGRDDPLRRSAASRGRLRHGLVRNRDLLA